MPRPKAKQERLFDVNRSGTARVRRHVDRQLAAQRATRTLEPVDDGLIGVVRTMADTIDREVTSPDGSAWTIIAGCRHLAAVLLELRGDRTLGTDLDAADTQLAALVAEIRNAARPDT